MEPILSNINEELPVVIIYEIFNDVISSSECTVSIDRMVSEEWIRKVWKDEFIA
jgi:hypothetical protein